MFIFLPSSSKLKQKGSNSSTSTSSSTAIDSLIIPLSVSKAEIRWVLKVLSSGFSLQSCLKNVFWQQNC